MTLGDRLEPESVSRKDFRERPGRSILYSILFLLWLPLVGLRFFWRQFVGLLGNIRGFIDWIQFDYVLPPAIRDLISWLIEIIPQALGLRDTGKYRQVASAAVLLFVAFLSTILTGGVAIAAYIIVAGLLAFGFARFIPWVNNRWTDTRSKLPIKDDYDVWRWSRE